MSTNEEATGFFVAIGTLDTISVKDCHVNIYPIGVSQSDGLYYFWVANSTSRLERKTQAADQKKGREELELWRMNPVVPKSVAKVASFESVDGRFETTGISEDGNTVAWLTDCGRGFSAALGSTLKIYLVDLASLQKFTYRGASNYYIPRFLDRHHHFSCYLLHSQESGLLFWLEA